MGYFYCFSFAYFFHFSKWILSSFRILNSEFLCNQNRLCLMKWHDMWNLLQSSRVGLWMRQVLLLVGSPWSWMARYLGLSLLCSLLLYMFGIFHSKVFPEILFSIRSDILSCLVLSLLQYTFKDHRGPAPWPESLMLSDILMSKIAHLFCGQKGTGLEMLLLWDSPPFQPTQDRCLGPEVQTSVKS